MFHVFIFAATLLLAFFSQFNCDDSDSPSPRIWGGNNTSPALYASDFQATGEVILSDDPTCICFLITPLFCLTSASCVTSRTTNAIASFDVIFHRDKTTAVGEVVAEGLNQSNIIYGPGFVNGDLNHNGDIALVQFNSPVTGITPLTLIKAGNNVDKRTCYASGWFTVNKQNLYPSILQNIQIPLLCSPSDMAACIAAWAAKTTPIVVDPVNMLCAGFYDVGMYVGPCNGERGTALQCRLDDNSLVAVGILINTFDCNTQDTDPSNRVPAVFLNIFTNLQWLDDTITKATGTSPGFA